MLQTMNEYLESRGIRISRGTIVDATIIHAPSSTKNRSGEREPELHPTRKCRPWYFGLKAHIGVDSKQGHVHSVCRSAASVADSICCRPAARRGTQGVGRRSVSGTGRSDRAGSSPGARYDQPAGEIQELCGRDREGEESSEGANTSESRTSVSYPEAHLWFRESEIPGIEEEPPAAVRLLRSGEPVSAPQTAGSGTGRSVSEVRVHRGLQQDRRNSEKNPLAVPSSIPTTPKATGCSEIP